MHTGHDVGVVPPKGAVTKPKGSGVPKVDAGVARCMKGLQPNPRDLWLWVRKVNQTSPLYHQTRRGPENSCNNNSGRSKMSTFTTDLGALQQWHTIQASHRFCSTESTWQTLDDGDILCHPLLVPPYLQVFDTASAKIGAERNPQKSEVIHHVQNLDAALFEWRISDVRPLTSVSRTAHGNVTLPECTVAQTFKKKKLAKIFEVGQRSLDRLFPGFAEDRNKPHLAPASQACTKSTGCCPPSAHCCSQFDSQTFERATSAGETRRPS